MSILSDTPDALGYFYGFATGDPRQINVRREGEKWVAYVGGDKVASLPWFDQAEAAAIRYIANNPPETADEPSNT